MYQPSNTSLKIKIHYLSCVPVEGGEQQKKKKNETKMNLSQEEIC